MSYKFEYEQGKIIKKLDDPKKCKYMYDEVCCNDSSKHIADYPGKDDCKRCMFFEVADNG